MPLQTVRYIVIKPPSDRTDYTSFAYSTGILFSQFSAAVVRHMPMTHDCSRKFGKQYRPTRASWVWFKNRRLRYVSRKKRFPKPEEGLADFNNFGYKHSW